MSDSAILADVAELVDALDLGSSVFGVRVRVSSSALFSMPCSERLSLLRQQHYHLKKVTTLLKSYSLLYYSHTHRRVVNEVYQLFMNE